MEDIRTVPITIGSHTVQEFEDNKLHKILDADGKTKYQFYEQKKAGGTSRAWQQWQDFELKPGLRVTAGVSEMQKSFVNKDGKNIPYKQRTIVYFEGDENGVPHMTDAPQGFKITQDMWENLRGDVDFLMAGVNIPEKDEINPEELPF